MNSPRVEACIAEVMARHPDTTPAAQARYFEAVHQELAPLARQLELELNSATANAGGIHERLQSQADEWRRRALAAERRTNWLLENPTKVLDITRRWDPTQGTLMEYLEYQVRVSLGENADSGGSSGQARRVPPVPAPTRSAMGGGK